MQEIQTLIAAEMLALKQQIQALVKSDNHLLQQALAHVFQAPGKQIRPMLVFLGAGACGGINAKTSRGAMLVTLLHQASLVHDDVVDQATYRRGRPTTNTVWNNKVAVLLGDYLLAKGFRMATQYHDDDLLALITETVQIMSEGELLQLEKIQTADITESVYLDIIYKKTAHLFGVCLAVGAITAGAPTAQVTTLRDAGEQIGMAFQLKDDWLDYSHETLDKPLAADLQEGNITLPLIHALQQASAQEKAVALDALRKARYAPEQQAKVLAFVRQSAGMDYTRNMMLQYQHQALQTLASTAPSPYQAALCTLMHHMV
ncbi:MAG: polyprenyl synthetase family protein [Bacteroidota bacterium]